MKKIAVFTTSQGHFSIAQAIIEKINQKPDAGFVATQFFSNILLMKEYNTIYKFAPFLFKIPYEMTKSKYAQSAFAKLSSKKFSKDILKFIEKENPDICISTHFIFNYSLEEICREKGIPLLNVLTNPGLSHPFELSESAAYNLAWDDDTKVLLENNYPNFSFYTTGWFVRKEFEEQYDTQAIRKKYNIQKDQFHIVVSSGSEGTTAIMKILPALIRLDGKIVVTVMCGKSRLLFEQATTLSKFVHTFSSNLEIRIIRFTDKTHEYFQSAHIIIGKAGPNTLFEAVATRTPFFAVTHISGQEDVNLEIIKEKKLGFSKESFFDLSTILEKVVTDKSVLQEFEAPIDLVAKHNEKSVERLLDLITKILK